jgi:hydrogenase nickel incorporation protein HypA/HybF
MGLDEGPKHIGINGTMHELSVTEALLKIAVEHAEKADATRVTDLNIVIGDLASMVDESIQFYWEIIAKGTIAEQAKLHFRRVPAELQCNTCSLKYQPTDKELICPHCLGIGAKIISGEEFFLESIDVE